MTSSVEELRQEVALAGRILEGEGLSEYVWGHVSARDPEGRGVWMKAGGLGFDEVGPENVLLVDWDGVVLEGVGYAHKEYPIHTAVMQARPAVGSVVHCHPENAIALMATGKPLRAFSHTAGIFSEGVPVYEQAVGLVDTVESGLAMAGALGDGRALFLDGHGVVTAGVDVGIATMTAVMLERACRLQNLVESAGGVARPYSVEEAEHLYRHTLGDAHLRGAWNYARRRATR